MERFRCFMEPFGSRWLQISAQYETISGCPYPTELIRTYSHNGDQAEARHNEENIKSGSEICSPKRGWLEHRAREGQSWAS